MKKKFLPCIIFLSIILISCSCKNDEEEVCLSYHSHPDSYIKDAECILTRGDTALYDSFFDTYADDGAVDMMLPFAMIMANKFDYNKAYYDVYYILTNLYFNFELYNFDIDSTTQAMAKEYYTKAIEKGYNIEN
jgi:hypothetical protein